MTPETDTDSAAVIDDRGTADCRIESREGGEVAWVTLDHPGKMNSIGSAMMDAMMAVFANLADREDLRVVVISGAGSRAFVGGAFLPELHSLNPESGRAFITKLHLAIQAIRDCPVPVIARMQGYCLGAGTELAAACDFRMADTSVVFGMPEVKVGLPSVIEAALLPLLIGWGKTREMLLTGANYDAGEGLAMGFLESVSEPDELDAAVEVRLAQIIGAGPLAVRAQKKLINAWEEITPAEGIQLGIDYLEETYRTDEPQRMMEPLINKKKN